MYSRHLNKDDGYYMGLPFPLAGHQDGQVTRKAPKGVATGKKMGQTLGKLESTACNRITRLPHPSRSRLETSTAAQGGRPTRRQRIWQPGRGAASKMGRTWDARHL